MKSDLIPSTSVLRCFEAAAKHQSYTAAAEELNVTQSAVSRQVRELEALLGVKLFRAAGRGVALTEAASDDGLPHTIPVVISALSGTLIMLNPT